MSLGACAYMYVCVCERVHVDVSFSACVNFYLGCCFHNCHDRPLVAIFVCECVGVGVDFVCVGE